MVDELGLVVFCVVLVVVFDFGDLMVFGVLGVVMCGIFCIVVRLGSDGWDMDEEFIDS